MRISLKEDLSIHGVGYALSFPVKQVSTFDEYRNLIPRGDIPVKLLHELKQDRILSEFSRLRRPRLSFVPKGLLERIPFPVPFMWKDGNLVVTAGKNYISDLLLGDESTGFTHCAVGSSTQAPVVGDTDLVAAQGARVAVTDPYRSGTSPHYDTFFNHSHGSNGTTINETGCFTASVAGTMWNRSLVSPGIAKTSGNSVTIAITGAW